MTAPQDDVTAEAPVSLGITGEFGAQLGHPFRLRASTECPGCGRRHVVDLEPTLQARPFGEMALAGVHVKAPASEAWGWRCTACGESGNSPAPAYTADLPGMTLGVCGHLMATGHYPSVGGHEVANCPGCCPACQAVKDGGR